jgi:hypothetical protein
MKLTISNLATKEITTTYGPRKVYRFSAAGQWYDAFAGTWNQGWRDGLEIEVGPAQIKSRMKDGKIYLTISAPAPTRLVEEGSAPISSGSAPAGSQAIVLLESILNELRAIKASLGRLGRA